MCRIDEMDEYNKKARALNKLIGTDINQMFPSALEEVQSVVREGEKIKVSNSWRTPDTYSFYDEIMEDIVEAGRRPTRNDLIRDHVLHAFWHLEKCTGDYISESEDMEDMSHAATRCLMAVQLMKEG